MGQEFYNTFRESKRHDLQKEYKDILIRTFKLSGLISFENALVNFSSRELASFVFKDLEIVSDLNDEAFVQNLSTSEILGFDTAKISELKKELIVKYKVPPGLQLNDFFKKAFDIDFENKVAQRYSDDKLCNILKMFGDRQQYDTIQEIVTKEQFLNI